MGEETLEQAAVRADDTQSDVIDPVSPPVRLNVGRDIPACLCMMCIFAVCCLPAMMGLMTGLAIGRGTLVNPLYEALITPAMPSQPYEWRACLYATREASRASLPRCQAANRPAWCEEFWRLTNATQLASARMLSHEALMCAEAARVPLRDGAVERIESALEQRAVTRVGATRARLPAALVRDALALPSNTTRDGVSAALAVSYRLGHAWRCRARDKALECTMW